MGYHTPGPPGHFNITSSELSMFGKYKSSESYDTWDSGGQPSAIGAWPGGATLGGMNSGVGWAYTINLPIFWDKDHDHDGMPLTFEEESGFTSMSDYNSADAYEDPDNDGFTNIQEYLARTNPNDDSSFFQFSDVRIVTNAGEPALCWVSPTVLITGFEAEYPQYARSLRFDILYADWTTAQQAEGKLPNEDWFNQTGTWNVLSTGTSLYRDPVSNFTSFTAAAGTMASLEDGDIRFFRLAVSGTAFEGEPVPGVFSYQSIGDPRIASTIAKEVMMVQKQGLNLTEYPAFGLAGDAPGGDGMFKFALGTAFLPQGLTAGDATNINLWVSQTEGNPNHSTVDFLQTGGNWMKQSDGMTYPSTDRIVAEEGFRLDYKKGLPSPAFLYLGAELKMTGYQHYVYRRDYDAFTWQTVNAGEAAWSNCSDAEPDCPIDDTIYYQASFLSYNYPVAVSFLDSGFPNLAGTTNPSFVYPIGAALESDWVVLYGTDPVNLAEGGTSERVIIYCDHSNGGQWTYFSPLLSMGDPVGPELLISPGSPVIVYQYWNPRDPEGTDFFLWESDVPYQSHGDNEIKSYLRYEDITP